jgi:hypothetical protein
LGKILAFPPVQPYNLKRRTHRFTRRRPEPPSPPTARIRSPSRSAI